MYAIAVYCVWAESPVKLLVKLVPEVPLVVIPKLDATVGEPAVFHTTPCAETVPPLVVMVCPPLLAEALVMLVAVTVVVIVGAFGNVVADAVGADAVR
jgi:hypothetical protein